MNKPREPGEWETLYKEQEFETMPWYLPGLDHDFDKALGALNTQGRSALDLGTGPGTQAEALAGRGLRVTATDIAATAIDKARSAATEKGLAIEFLRDDILDTKLTKPFDLVFDRGCFHVLAPESRSDYVRTIHDLLAPDGYLFLKCFSHLETSTEGPYRFTPEEIRDIFGIRFEIESIEESVFHGTLDHPPRALFCTMKKRD